MIYQLRNKFKLESGDVVDRLTIRESVTLGDNTFAVAEAKKDGAVDIDRYTAELIARLAGITYVDVLGMDIRDFKELDEKLGTLMDPKADRPEPSKPGSTPSKGSKT